MKKGIYLLLILIFFSCSKNNSQLNNSESISVDNNSSIKNISNLKTQENVEINEEKMTIDENEEKLMYFGTVYNTKVTDDNVNVRLYPSLEAKIVNKVNKNTKIIVFGTSKEKQEIDGHFGYWYKIWIEKQWEKEGWIFSKYVENSQITPTEIIVNYLPQKREGYSQNLICSYLLNGKKINLDLSPYKIDSQDFYTFRLDFSNESYHYTNIPGTYIWYPMTNELKHITYIGEDLESAWCIFTDDFKYILSDGGTSPGPRAVSIWRVKDSENVFSGSYYRNVNLRGYTIDIVYVYDEWNISHNRIDNEILNFAEDYIKNNTKPENTNTLIITCEYNIDTGIRNIKEGKYIYTQ